ncbi:hypothetical protein QTJ16_006133 [Diplocarpon rosae]|uniref:Uncharacterized protein n=1 Tax=Diplocarpon rosae TaxID=946125 RepID=A0AAD9WBJ6_9HELO|nr:hypothetical protein QTJ16_006133 [Diplocarpon rosae]
MASASDPLLADPERPSTSPYASSSHHSNIQTTGAERTSLLPKFTHRISLPKVALPKISFPALSVHRPTLSTLDARSVLPALPYSTTIHPTLHTRSLSALLLLSAFIAFILLRPSHINTSNVVFLSFALARQLFILIAHFSTRLFVIRIEVVNPRLQAVRDRTRERAVRTGIALSVDGAVLLGLLVTLTLGAVNVDRNGGGGVLEAGVVLGFLGLGLLLISVPDFGNPELVTMSISIEKPSAGIHKLSTSLTFGQVESEELDEEAAETEGDHGGNGKIRRCYL